MLFDPCRHLCVTDVKFTASGAVLTVRWSKVIQFQERFLHIPLPKIPNSPLCPSTALLRLTLENPQCVRPPPVFRYTWMGAVNVPTTQQQFSEKLQVCLDTIGLDSSKCSSHSLRRGGASFALQCDLSVDLIKIQGTGVVMHVKDIWNRPLSYGVRWLYKWEIQWGPSLPSSGKQVNDKLRWT